MKQNIFTLILCLGIGIFSFGQEELVVDSPVPEEYSNFTLLEKIKTSERLYEINRPLSELEKLFVQDLLSDANSSDNPILRDAGRGSATLLEIQDSLAIWELQRAETLAIQRQKEAVQRDLQANHDFINAASGTSAAIGASSAILSVLFYQLSLSSYNQYISTNPNDDDFRERQNEYITQELLSYGFAATAIVSAITVMVFEFNRK
jgi:hypothetical protein